MNFSECTIENVGDNINLWKDSDPVRPELSVDFKTKPGRYVYGLKNDKKEYIAFVCFSKSVGVPSDITTLSAMTNVAGRIAVPYTVWSNHRGAGRVIIKKLIDLVKNDDVADRVVTLSPKTEMAKAFHLRNSATIYRENVMTVNFEYSLKD